MNPIIPSYKILGYFYRHRSQNLKLILDRYFKKNPGLFPQQTSRLVYGVIRQEKKLDWVISKLSRTQKVSRENRILLQMGASLLLFSQSFPDYAVVNEIVSLGQQKSRGFLNALLRKIAGNRQSLEADLARIPELEIRHSISPFLLQSLEKVSKTPNSYMEYLDQEPVFHVRANTGLISYDRFRELVFKESPEARELSDFQSFEIHNPGKIRGPILEKNYGFLQNLGSQLVSMAAARFAKKSVLDCCAAPGSKSLTLQLLSPGLRIVASDISQKRMVLMKKFHFQNRLPEKDWAIMDICSPAVKNGFDLVVVDAPCSASGTLRKNPDLKLKITARTVARQSALQRRILETVLTSYSSARILYAVCSFIPEETEELIESIASQKKPGFPLESLDLSPLLDSLAFQYQKTRWGFYLLPDPHLNNDLFYLSLLKRHPVLGEGGKIT